MCHIALDGEITIYAALELKDELLPPLAQCETAELDLSGVSEIDSAGLQLLIMAKAEAKTHGKTLVITSHSPAVLDILDLCDLEGFFGDNVLILTTHYKPKV
ncbi:MAG: STAS domain-containing protein [Undibacterium sp.]|uniref:STAS domain-containing protein n=1 Tax=Undibacterium sp. TaxID=1914977 RepID=UPI002719FD6E|nr:STAS domain-containing protein [Undibacterium sp.]MDO8654753.1 STAS domain-containing protein [Undibacterium sp.]